MQDLQAVFREYMHLERQRTNSDLSVSEMQRWNELKQMLNQKIHPRMKKGAADRRASVRAPVNLRVSFKSYGEVSKCLMTNLSRGGLFISTEAPLEIGTPIHLRVQINESESEVEVSGKVVSINTGSYGSKGTGMGVSFGELNPAEQKAVDELYENCMHSAFPLGR